MNNRVSHITKILLVVCLAFLGIQQAKAQFTVTEDFRGSVGPDIIVGDNAHLTSGIEDPVGAGWLRLTEDKGDQRGYAYINKSFPSTLGVLVDFEYTMWRSEADPYGGADGISVFLFDANYGPNNFELGAYGGSLGYANSTQSNPVSQYGLTGGYLGIGLDAYGNFTAGSEGKNGGSTGNPRISPNSITLRGPNTGNTSTTTRYLKGVTILNNADGQIVDALSKSGNTNHNVIDYNTITPDRPSKDQFYRRVQIEIVPTEEGKYEITVRWATEFGGEFRDLMTYTTEDAPPDHLKMGFAASTGGGWNNQEIRNVLITTPGNLRVSKSAGKDVLRSQDPNNEDEDKITYAIQVNNDTKAALSAIDFDDQLTDGNGDPIPEGMFEITAIEPSNDFVAEETVLPNPSESNPITNGKFEGTLSLPAETTGTILVKGKLTAIPAKNKLVNTTSAFPTTITDQDLQNNTASVSTPVVSEQADLVIEARADQSCLNTSAGNEVTLTVSNVGNLPLTYGNDPGNKLTVTTTIPNGSTLTNNTPATYDWQMSHTGNVYTFTKNVPGRGNPTETLGSGKSLLPIQYTISNATTGFTGEVQVNDEIEPSENRNNNTDEYIIDTPPDAPTVLADEIIYCPFEEAVPLEAEASTPGNILLWSLSEDGIVTTTPYTPNTTQLGETTYYVREQAPGGCISDYKTITVKVEIGENCKVCTAPVKGEAFEWDSENDNLPSDTVTQTLTQPAANAGFTFDIYELDNSFNMKINGTPLATSEIEFQSTGTSGINIKFKDEDEYETDTDGDIWEMNGNAEHPLIRVKISPSGGVTMYGSKESGGELYELELFNGNEFNTIDWNAAGENTIVVTQNVVGVTTMDGYGYGSDIADCQPYTITKDGVFNDENGDGFAQIGETVTYTVKVQNKGDIPVYNPAIQDPMFGGLITTTPNGDDNSNGILDTDETWIYTLTHTLDNQDSGEIALYNQATVQGQNEVGDDFDKEESVDTTPISHNSPEYDPNRPDHTVVPLKWPLHPIPTNPMLLNQAKKSTD